MYSFWFRWTKAFTPKAIAEYLPSIEIRLDEMISIIDDHVKQKQDVDLCLQLGCFVYNSQPELFLTVSLALMLNLHVWKISMPI